MTGTDRLILGANAEFSTDSRETGLNNNVVVCGGSGGGKTMSVIEPRLLDTFQSSLIVTVTKRRIVDKYKRLFQNRGYEVQDLNFVSPEKSSVSYDPLAYIENDTDIIFLAKSIVKSYSGGTLHKGDPYWDEAATSLLSAEIGLALAMHKGSTFADVLKIHDMLSISDSSEGIKTTLDWNFNNMKRKYPENPALSCWNSFRELPIRTAQCVYGTLNTAIDTLFTQDVRKMMAEGTKIDFGRLAREKTVLFVSSSPVNPNQNRLVNIFYGQAFKQLFEYAENQPDGRLPRPVHILCDDFATGGRIADFPEYISILREKQISVTMLLQSESQLVSMYGAENAVTIINNCDTYLYLGGMDLRTAQSVSLRLNAPLDEILYMPIGREIIFRRGQRPIVTGRYPILEDERYQNMNVQNNDGEREVRI